MLARALEREVPHLERYARSLTRDPVDVEDLTQDCLERAISRIHQFRPGTEKRRWLFTILHRIHIDDCRRATLQGRSVPLEELRKEMSHPVAQELRLEVGDAERRLSELRPCDRVTVLLSEFTNLSQERIARRTNAAVGTVKSRLSRAREALAA